MSETGRQYVQMFSLDHPPGMWRVRCPKCNGGSSGQSSMNITIEAAGQAKWKCHRASCTEKGATGVAPRALDLNWDMRAASKVKPYWGESWSPTEDDILYFMTRFSVAADITRYAIRRNVPDGCAVGAYVFPIFNIWGRVRGHVVRQPAWKGEPRAPLLSEPDEPKARTWPNCAEPMQSWYFPNGEEDGTIPWIVIVEDQVSAMAVASAGFTGLALLGTHLNTNRVREIQRLKPERTILALDNDAEGEALRLAQKWGMALPGFHLHLLHEDLKDSPDVFEELAG